jgi:hypothetical protein
VPKIWGIAVRVRGLRRLIWYGAVALSLAACASLPRNPVPLGLESDAAVVGMGGETIRFWGDVPPPNVDAMAKEKWAQVRASHRQLPRENGRPVVSFLAISAAVRMAPSAPACLPAGPHAAIVRNSTW